MSASFAIIVALHVPHENLYLTLERKLKGTLSLKRKNLLRRVVDFKITSILQKGRFLLILFCKRVLITRGKLPRYGRAINNFFSQQSIQREYAKTFYSKSFNAIVNHFDGKRILS